MRGEKRKMRGEKRRMTWEKERSQCVSASKQHAQIGSSLCPPLCIGEGMDVRADQKGF